MSRSEGLVAERLSVRLGGALVLRDVSLAVVPGETLGVFGPSGAGKSTLFRALAGELAPDEGRVLLAGVDVTRRALWERARLGLGYVPQTPSVLLDLTVEENFAVFTTLAKKRAGAAPPSVSHLVEALGLHGRLRVRAGALSGGERRRLELGRALCAGPAVLLCDEPFAAVDPQGTEAACELLRAAARAGAGIILADHHVAVALGLCDRAALLVDGVIAVEATPEAFQKDALVRRHYTLER